METLRRNASSCIEFGWKGFTLGFKILPAGLRINLTSDRLTGEKKSLIDCVQSPSKEIEAQRNDQSRQFLCFLDKKTINLYEIGKTKLIFAGFSW